MKYPLGFNTWTEQEKKSAKKVIDSGFYTMGKKTNLLENLKLNMRQW